METLYNLLETEVGIEDARRIEFQRVHRVGKAQGTESYHSTLPQIPWPRSSVLSPLVP